jgi:hypothetical protein
VVCHWLLLLPLLLLHYCNDSVVKY